jgi:hypothetical protein
MDMETRDAVSARHRRAEFWERLVRTIRSQGVGGSTESVAHEIAFETRRLATDFKTPERWLLEVSKVFGHGSRVGRPFAVLVLAALLTTIVLLIVSDTRANFWPLLLDTVVSPVTFIRPIEGDILTQVLTEGGAWERLVVIVMRILGTGSLVFAAFAIRSYTRLAR